MILIHVPLTFNFLLLLDRVLSFNIIYVPFVCVCVYVFYNTTKFLLILWKYIYFVVIFVTMIFIQGN